MGDKSKELQRKIYIAEQKLRACQHREKLLERQMSELNRRERVHRLCTRAGIYKLFFIALIVKNS